MAASKNMIQRWFEEGVKQGASHMIVVTDTWDWEDYPVYVRPPAKPQNVVKKRENQAHQKVTEVYNLKMDMAKQLAEHRAFNY
jgi:hypothetical protein